VGAFGLVLYLWWRYQRSNSKDGGGELAMQLTDNPLQGHMQNQSLTGSDQAAERRSNVYLAVRVLYQPDSILVGYIHVKFN
jgi:hypothetical protein